MAASPSPARSALALLFAAGAGLMAQAPPAGELPPEPGIQALLAALNTPVISASKLAQDLRRAPAKVVVVRAQDIQARGYLDLEEILHDYAGFDFEKGMGVHWSQIYMRGLRSTNSDRFLFIWDGVIQNDIGAQVTWFERQFPLSAIERIEIMYGPSSLLYGANAFSGIINVILRQERSLDGFRLQASQGAFRTRSLELTAGKQLGDWAFFATGKLLRSDEWDWGGESWTDAGGRTRSYGLGPSNYDLAALAAKGNVGPDGRLRVLMDGRYQPWNDHQGSPTRDHFLELGAAYGAWKLRAMHWYREESEDKWSTPQAVMNSLWVPTANALHLSHEGHPWEGWESRSYAIMRTTGLDDRSRESEPSAVFTPGDPREFQILDLGAYGYYKLFNREYRLGQQFSHQREGLSAVLGAEYVDAFIRESYAYRHLSTEPWPLTPRHELRNLGLFAQAQAEVPGGFELAAGLRYDYNWEAGGSGGFHHLLSSRLAAIFPLSRDQTFKVIYGQAFQEPPALKRFTTTPNRPLASPNLKPERLDALELNWSWHAGRRWRTSLALYFNQIENLIQQVPATYQGRSINKFENTGKLRILGSELEVRRFWGVHDSAYLNLSSARAKDPETGQGTGGIAPLQAHAGLDLRWRERLGLGLRLHAVAARRTANEGSASPYVVQGVPPYFTADLTATWYGFRKGLDLRLNVYNLTDARYFDPAPRSGDGIYYNGAILQQPRRAFLGLSWRF
jgi:iron complex outermembrane receptor protein